MRRRWATSRCAGCRRCGAASWHRSPAACSWMRRPCRRCWTYYDQLLAYREQPAPEEAMRLDGAFDALFSTVTGYNALDERIARTRAKKSCLLMVLAHPEIPLHNNPAELGA